MEGQHVHDVYHNHMKIILKLEFSASEYMFIDASK